MSMNCETCAYYTYDDDYEDYYCSADLDEDDSQTGIITFLIQNARKDGDKEREAKLLKSAKMRRSLNFAKVQEDLGDL